jgi:ERCC4-type nuclease
VAIKGYAVVTPGEEDQPAKIVMILDTREEAEEIARSLRDKGIKATVEPTPAPER